jgi:hypothetical protein
MTPVEFFDQEIGIPFGLDYQFGVSDSIAHRVSPMVPIKEAPLDMGAVDPAGVAAKTFTGPFFADSVGLPHFLSFPFTMNGITNARSIATAQAVVSHGGEFRGRRLLKQSTIDLIFEQQSNGIDLVLGMPMKFGIGYAMPSTDWATIPRGRSCWWAGWGGSRIVNMLEHRATFAYAMNTMKQGILGDPRSFDMFNAVVEALES